MVPRSSSNGIAPLSTEPWESFRSEPRKVWPGAGLACSPIGVLVAPFTTVMPLARKALDALIPARIEDGIAQANLGNPLRQVGR